MKQDETNTISAGKAKPSVERPWQRFYSDDLVAKPLPACTFYEYFVEVNRDFPDEIAFCYLGRTIRYGEVARYIDHCARSLLALGVKRNDIVTVAMPSMPEAVYVVYAINRIGAIANMIHPLAGTEETLCYLEEVQSRVFIMYSGTYSFMRGHLDGTCVEKAVVVSPAQSLSPVKCWLYGVKNPKERIREGGVVLSWKSFIGMGKERELSEPQQADDDWAVITHTGGTTGPPKGVITSNRNIIGQIFQVIQGRGIKRQDCMLVQLPPFVNYSLVNIIKSLSCGYKIVLIPKYNPERLAELVYRYKVNYIYSIPAYWEALFRIPNIRKDAFASLRAIASGGESMDAATEKAVNDILHAGGGKLDLMKGYGMTESTSGIVGTFPFCNVQGSVGIPLTQTNCRVVDVNTGEELSYGEEGELCFSGPTIMVGYYHQQEATDEIIKTDSDGVRWLHTGDIGYISEEGIVYISGRLKRLIMVKDDKGMVTKIFPERIEEVFSRCPQVGVCCVVGVPDEQYISKTKLFVELAAGYIPDDSTGMQILLYGHDELPSYMAPTEVEILGSLPRTNRGKIDYRELENRVRTPNKLPLNN